VGPRVGLDGCGKYRPHRDSIHIHTHTHTYIYIYKTVVALCHKNCGQPCFMSLEDASAPYLQLSTVTENNINARIYNAHPALASRNVVS